MGHRKKSYIFIAILMKFKNGRTPFWNDVTAVWTVFTILRMCKKTSTNIEKSCYKSWKMTSPGLLKSIKKLVQKNVAKKKRKKLDFLLKWWKIDPQWIPKGVSRGLPFSSFFNDFPSLGPRWLPDTLPGVSQRAPRIVFSWFAEVLRSVFLMFSGQKDKVNHLGKTSVLI